MDKKTSCNNDHPLVTRGDLSIKSCLKRAPFQIYRWCACVQRMQRAVIKVLANEMCRTPFSCRAYFRASSLIVVLPLKNVMYLNELSPL